MKFSNAIRWLVPTSRFLNVNFSFSDSSSHSEIICDTSAACTCILLPNSAILFLKDSSDSGDGPSKNDVSSFILIWFGIVSTKLITLALKFSHELTPAFSCSSSFTSPKSYCGCSVLLVLNILISFISGNSGKLSLINSLSSLLNSKIPSAKFISFFNSAAISSQRSNSLITESLFSKVNASKIVVLPASFLPINAPKSPTLTSPES